MSYSWSSTSAMENILIFTGGFWFGNSAPSHCSTFIMWHQIIKSRIMSATVKIRARKASHNICIHSGCVGNCKVLSVHGKLWQNNIKGLCALKCVNRKVSLCVVFVRFTGLSIGHRASCPSGTHNKASCSTLWGSGRGSTIATIWALWGPALWSGAAELGKLEQWGISGHQKELWVPAAARAHNAPFGTRGNSCEVSFRCVYH